jgi:hypothetical protein
MTLMRLHDCFENHIFKRVSLLHDIVKNGIMDFLVSPDVEGRLLFGPEFYNQIGQPHLEETKNAEDYTEMVAPLDTDKIKPADRVSFLLNYLYLCLRNSQLLESAHSSELTTLRELFVNSLDSYVQIMALWISKGELADPFNEFFIKVNPKLQLEEFKSSRE